MKKTLLKTLSLILLLTCILTACTPTPDDPEPTCYRGFEVKRTWGSIFGQQDSVKLEYEEIEEGVEPIEAMVGEKLFTFNYKSTNRLYRLYEYEGENFCITYCTSTVTGEMYSFEINGAVSEVIDGYQSTLDNIHTEQEYLNLVGIYLDELGVDDLDTRNYECWTYDTDSLSFDPDHFNGDNEFKELPLESGEWTHYSFEFTKSGIDGVKIQDDVIVVIGAEKFGVTVSRMPADFGEINFDKNEVMAAVQECVENEVRSGYKIEDVSLNESMMYLTTYKGRLCCVITEFIVDYTSKSDNSPYNMLLHDHCGAIVFLE